MEDEAKGQVGFSFSHIMRKAYMGDGKKYEPFIYLQLLFNRTIVVQDPDAVRDFATTKNMSFDKSPMLFEMIKEFLGNAFIFDQSTEEWKLKRKICSHGFYKDKLIAMTETMRQKSFEAVKKWKKEAEKGDGKAYFNMTHEL